MNNLLYISILILIIVSCITILYKPGRNTQENFKECKYDHLILNREQLADTKELLLKFKELAKELRIDYFAIGGTLIGTVRNGGLLPLDDDIDIGIFKKDYEKLNNYRNGEYYIKKIGFGFKLKKNDSDMFIDIMVFELSDNKYKIINDSFPSEYFNKDEIIPLKKMMYSNIQIYVPNKYVEYLNRVFPDWDKTVKVGCGHHGSCVYKKHNIPSEFDIDYDNSKYSCYSKL